MFIKIRFKNIATDSYVVLGRVIQMKAFMIVLFH